MAATLAFNWDFLFKIYYTILRFASSGFVFGFYLNAKLLAVVHGGG
jgi:hypothetical protein